MEKHRASLLLALAVCAPACTTTETVTESSVDPLEARYASGNAPASHRERAHLVDTQSTHQVLLTSKFVELSTKEFKGHDVLGDPRFQRRIRKLSQMPGADLMTAPSVVTRNGQRAKVEVIRELPLKGGAYDEQVNLGVTLDVVPSILKDGRVHLSGKATVRELDVPPHEFDGNSAFAVQSSDVFFDAVVEDGQTMQVICRDKDTAGQRIAFLSARLIDPAGMPINRN